MKEMVGSEKQIKWANDIKQKNIKKLEDVLKVVKNNNCVPKEFCFSDGKVVDTEEDFQISVQTIKQIINLIKQEESAKYIIENRENLIDSIADKHGLDPYDYEQIILAYELLTEKKSIKI